MMKNLNIISNRESQVLFLLSIGKSTLEIANDLFLSFNTIKTHRNRLMEKLEANNVAQMIRLGFENGLLSIEQSN